MQASLPDTHNDLRAAPRALCAQFAPEYHRQHAGRKPRRGSSERVIVHHRRRHGSLFRPEKILFVDDLPRARKMKIMRQVLRVVFENQDACDLFALANPEAADRLREKLGNA
ncbi:hypothetical protein [uncultured Bradyrhizobium sp.]|uniref:hypothetical protein n=1 Tax=Bradyrhizobium sp. TaxID=376 RepID=UPI00261CFFEF|nr:hypothetical protein [uncultured Bradyrhizobium sp.]